jgi:hypothetical protein
MGADRPLVRTCDTPSCTPRRCMAWVPLCGGAVPGRATPKGTGWPGRSTGPPGFMGLPVAMAM